MKRTQLVLAFVLAALALTTSAASAADLPQQWDPRQVALNHDPANSFLLRPGQILAASRDAGDVARVLTGWRLDEQRPAGIAVFRSPTVGADPAKEVLDALARVRRATGTRPQGPALVAPNYVFVGEAVSTTAAAVNFMGEPRIQGGNSSTALQASLPAALPLRTTSAGDGKGARIAVLDTGMFDHQWLTSVQRAPNSDDVWDVEGDGYGDAESGHGTFIAGLIAQVAPSASIYASKVLDSHGVGDDLGVAKAMMALPTDIDVVNLSLGGYTDRDAPPLAITTAMSLMGEHPPVVVAAAGNAGSKRPFWPAAFPQVLAVGAVEDGGGKWGRASYSNFGPWVDATARGTNIQSTFSREKTKVATGGVASRFDPTIAFDGWAAWDGTSFSTPIAAAMIARTMTRAGLHSPAEAQLKLLLNSPAAAQADFPHAVFLDEMEGRPAPETALP